MIYSGALCLFFAFAAVQGALASNHGLRAKRLNRHHCHPAVTSRVSSIIHASSVLTVPRTTQSELQHSAEPAKSTMPINEPIPSSSVSPTQDATRPATTVPAPTLPTAGLKPSLTPNGIKAGIAGGDAYPFLQDHIGWWYDWTPKPSKSGKPVAVSMLWGVGTADSTDAARLDQFKKIKTPPSFVLAYEEPDCPPGSGSAGVSVSAGVSGWESLVVPLGKKGSILGSPSMCKQADETWLAEFRSRISHDWDFTAIHINKNTLAGVKKDIDHYWNTYRKPIWVTEFACVNDHNGFVPCTDQREIDAYINDIVPFLEANDHVYAYAYSNGLGLGDVWPLMDGNSLSASGRTYLTAISKYH